MCCPKKWKALLGGPVDGPGLLMARADFILSGCYDIRRINTVNTLLMLIVLLVCRYNT